MQVLGGHTYDHSHSLSGSGAYEWWYVDAESHDGQWGIVVILFRGMPMSPDYLAALQRGDAVPADHCGYAVSVYHRGVRIATAFHGVNEVDCAYSEVDCDVRTGPVRFRRMDDGRYLLEADTTIHLAPQAVRIRAELTPLAPIAGTATESDVHAWILAAPRTEATVQITFVEHGRVALESTWQGMGYHDHNLGLHSMQDDLADWYWGRLHTADRTFVYLATAGAGTHFAWLGLIDRSGLQSCSNVELRLTSPRWTLMGLRTHSTIQVRGTEPSGVPLDIMCTNDGVVENGPFYQRYTSTWRVNGNDSVARGMSEYMDCTRYRRSWIRPFLRTMWQVRT